ncbi:MAG TPA: calcium-binding protein [Candidatus Obscuribacterales bacterium]
MGTDLLIALIGTGEQLRVQGQYMGDPSRVVEKIGFADGTVLSRWQVDDLLEVRGTAGNDHLGGSESGESLVGEEADDNLWGYGGSDKLFGGAGSDWLNGGLGGDMLSGGSGFDQLQGGAGNDTYLANLGDGMDYIQEGDMSGSGLPGGTDRIKFGQGIGTSNVAFFMNGSGLQVAYSSTDSLWVLNQAEPNTAIERLQLDNGMYLTDMDINTIIQQMSAWAANNSASFTSVSDVQQNPNLMNIIATSWHAA